MRLLRIPRPFDHSEFIFEPKLDGFRALAYIESHRCSLISRNGYAFKSWPQFCEKLADAVRQDRRPRRRNLLPRRQRIHKFQPPTAPARLAVLLRVRPADVQRA
jgi:hypothetical protein